MQAGKPELELLAIRTLCAGKDAGLSLLNSLNAQHFHYPTTQLMYRRLMARLKGEGHVPAWDDLLNDPTVPEEKRQNAQRVVRRKKLKPLIKVANGEALFTSLDNYRKLRALYETINKVGNSLSQPTANIDELIKTAKSELIAIDVNHRGAPITVDGLKGAHVVEALTNAAARIRTGYKEFDERSGGIPQGAVMLLGADTGGYKSVNALQIAQNMARNKHRVGFYSLEMVLEEITQRATANVTETNVSDLIAEYINDLNRAKTPAEVEKIKARQIKLAEDRARKYEEASKEWTDFLHITCPAEEVDINWVLQQAEMSDREVIIVDYVGLLAGLSGDDQWRAMSNVVRQCKIWCNRTGKTVLILAQMRFDDGKPELKYSKAILDHCVSGDTLIDTGQGIVTIESLSGEKGPRQSLSVPIITDGNKQSVTSHFHHNGRKAVVDMFLQDGRRLRVTPNHKIRVLLPTMELGWKKVEDLQPSDFVALSSNTNFHKTQVSLDFPAYDPSHHNDKPIAYPKTLDIRLAYLIGMLLSDGHLSGKTVMWVTKDYDVAVKLKSYCDSLFGESYFGLHTSTTPYGTTIWRVRSGRKSAVQFFDNFAGLQGGSHHKYIPDEILRSPKTVVQECIKGMMDGDGCNDGNIIHYTSTSRRMVERLQILLDKFGVSGVIRNRPHINNDYAQAYQLQIMGADILVYLQTIGFTTARKNNRELKSNVGAFTGKFPLLNEYLLDSKYDSEVRGVTSLRSKIKECAGVRVDRNINEDNVNKVTVRRIKALDYDLGRKLSVIVYGGYKFSAFARTEMAGVEDVYDLTVPETHNYVANGISSHNCNNAWGWTKLDVDGRTYLCVHQMKARAQKQYAFVLRAWPEFNKIGDLVDLKDEEVARNAIEDMNKRKDPAKRYEKATNDNEEKGRKDIELDDDNEVVQLKGGGFAGVNKKVRTHVLNGEASPPWEDDNGPSRSNGTFASKAGQRVTTSSIRKAADSKTRVVALAKLNAKVGNLSIEEAGIQAEEVIKRYEEAVIGHRIGVTKLAKELLGLSKTKEILTQVRKLQGDKAALRKLSKQELEIHRAQIEVIKQATDAIKIKGREYVSEADFYAVDDLTMAVERGEEPIASARTLDQPWQNNAVAWADQPAITLPNSAKPTDKRWGANGVEASVQRYKKANAAYINKGNVQHRLKLWPPASGEISDYHYLDDIQLDTAVSIAEKYAKTAVADVPVAELAHDVAQYVELIGPGKARLNNRKRKRLVFTEQSYKTACKKLGVTYNGA